MNKKLRWSIGGVLILIALCIYFYPDYGDWQMKRQAQNVVSDYRTQWDELIAAPAEAALTAGESTQGEATGTVDTEFVDLRAAMEAYNSSLFADGQALLDAWSYQQPPLGIDWPTDIPFGYLEIPAMTLELPLYLGASTQHMSRGAVVMSQTSLPVGGENTNTVIAAHRGYRGMAYFREIEKLTEGDEIYLTNPWEKLTYRVTSIAVIDPNDVNSILIQPNRDMITLLTCHPYMSGGKQRYVVFCDRAAASDAVPEPEQTVPQTVPETGTAPEGEQTAPETGTAPELPTVAADSSEGFIRFERILHYTLPVVGVVALIVSELLRNRKKK